MQSLDLDTSFEAVSYTWGDPLKARSLMVDNCLLPITRNAYEIISKFASTGQSRLLWIDAICINQNDDDDKSQQVRLMREIYSTASRVIVWLGSPPDARHAQSFFRRLRTQNSRNKGTSDKTLLLPTLLNDDNAEWLAFRKVLSHPYWTRVWVVQEIVVARKAHVYYGGKFWKWAHFARTVCSLLSEEKRTLLRKISRLEGLTAPHFAGVEKVSMIDAIRRQYRGQPHDNLASLPSTLIKFSDSHATVEKDRVFAFLGISSASTDHTLEPDYSRSDREVFEVVARHSLRTKLPFLYFSVAGLANGIESDKWPSWVPDLRKAPGIRLPFPLWDFGKYHASAEAQPNVDIPKAGHEITVEGVFVDEIEIVAEMTSTIDPEEAAQLSQHGRFTTERVMLAFYERERRRYEEAWEIALRKTPEIYAPTGQTRKEAFRRTLLCDMSSNPSESDSVFDDDYEKWMDPNWPKTQNGKPTYDNDTHCPEKPLDHQDVANHPLHLPLSLENKTRTSHTPQTMPMPDLTWFPLRLTMSSFRRQFAITKKGYMALVVPGIRAGDVICVFSGAETPHALRRDGDGGGGGQSSTLRLIGDAYVHGWMDGRMFVALANGKGKGKEGFVIR
jgi:hypothetical protein